MKWASVVSESARFDEALDETTDRLASRLANPIDAEGGEHIREALGDVPLGGFFGIGEIGPVGGRTFVRGSTSALGPFRTP
ncbi:MAG: hypothetical protein ACOCUS_03895 [Polyangiales bacterium]